MKNMENQIPAKRERQLIIIGAGGHASNIVNVALSLNYSILGFIHNQRAREKLFEYPIFCDLNDIDNLENYEFCLALGDNYQREKYLKEIQKKYPFAKFPTLIHPTASIGPYSQIDVGTIIMPNVVVNTNVIVGSFCILGSQSCVGHDARLANFSSLSPAAIIAGNVNLGYRSTIGLGAKVREKVIIGNDTILGANSFLNMDLPDNVVALGTPAKIKKNRDNSESYLR